MKYSSGHEQNINALDFCVDFSKNENCRFLEQRGANPQLTSTPTAEEINLMLEDGIKLEKELQHKYVTFKDTYKPILVKLQEKKQANQKLKRQALPNNLVPQIRNQNPPSKPLNPVIPKDRLQQRIQHETPLIQNPPIKLEKLNNNQTTTQSRHHDKKNVSKSTGNEKPSRPVTDKVNKSSVWYKAEPFFQKLPSKEEYRKLFSIIDDIVEKRKAREKDIQNDANPVHWSVRMNEYVRPGKKMLKVPAPPPDANDISDFWKNAQIPFQVEAVQKRSFSCFHYLINSFIELDNIPAQNSNSPISSPSQNNELKTKENDDPTQKHREPVPITCFALLPQIESETYMALSFDQRLSLELESLGLNLPSGSVIKRLSPIEREIKTKKTENNEIISTLIEMRDSIMDNIDEFQLEQQKRDEMIEKSRAELAKLPASKQSK